jgi:RAT1-interacting protein
MSFGSSEFWEQWYQSRSQTAGIEDQVEWYVTMTQMRQTLLDEVLKDRYTARILIIGCGNSVLGEDLMSLGFKNVLSVDYSASVIKQMKLRFPQHATTYVVADVCDMSKVVLASHGESSSGGSAFDVIIDKGTLDSILCCDDAGSATVRLFDELQAVAAPNATLVVVSDGMPHEREHYFRALTRSAVQHRLLSADRSRPSVGFAAAEQYHLYLLTINNNNNNNKKQEQ